MKKYCLLMETDPGNSLGGSCIIDLYNTGNYLINKVTEIEKIFVITTSILNSEKQSRFPNKCKFSVFEKSKNNIIKQLTDITQQIDNDSFFFVSISGHGYQIRDNDDGDEIDGFDEYVSVGTQNIIDDDLWNIFINNLSIIKKNIKFIGLTDTCHSGTMYDLAYSYKNNNWIKATKRQPCINNNFEGISIGACNDNELDNCDIGNIGFGGALTVHMIDNDMIKDLFDETKDKIKIKEIYNKLKLIFRKLNQNPVLQTNKPF